MGWQEMIALWIGGTVLLGVLIWLRSRTRKTCEYCFYPVDKCACKKCDHLWWRWRWSQDGYVRRCKLCGDWQYGGDDYDGGPDDQGRVVSA